ncbi:MAG: metal ABC transporter permease [Solirubrobacteraceae bacterium]
MSSVWHVLADPWSQEIMRRAFTEVVLLGVAGGALGCWIVFYNLSYSAESLAHALLPGLVLAALVGIPLLLGGAVGILVAAIAVALAGRTPQIGRDTAVAVVITGLFGLGVLLVLSRASPPGLQGLLFGDVLGVSDGDLMLAAGLAVADRSLGAAGRLLVVGFDRLSARTLGIAPTAVDIALLGLLALALLVAVQGLGNLLVVAVLIAPAATARSLTRRMKPMIVLSIAIALVSGVGGLYLSYYASTAAGASIAAMLIAVYAALARRPSVALGGVGPNGTHTPVSGHAPISTPNVHCSSPSSPASSSTLTPRRSAFSSFEPGEAPATT